MSQQNEHAPGTLDELYAARLWPAIRGLNKMVSAYGQERLPQIFEELLRYRVPIEIVDGLRTLVSEGYSEGEVVRAFLETLRPLAIRFRASRALIRALRKDFTWIARPWGLQQRIADVVANALPGDRRDRADVA